MKLPITNRGDLINMNGLTSAEEKQLLAADENLKRAKAAYRALEPLRMKQTVHLLSQPRRSRKKLTESEILLAREKEEKRSKQWRLGCEKERQEHAFFHSYEEFDTIPIQSEGLVSRFYKIESLDKFAKHINVTRKTAIQMLRNKGLNLIEEIAIAWENGSSLRKLSKLHGPLPQTISKWIKSTGRNMQPRNSNRKYDVELIEKLFDEKCTTNKIAKLLGLSWATVQKLQNERR